MKVYNKIVFDFDFNVIEEDSYEYKGPTDRCDGGGGGDVSAQGMADAQANSEASANNSGFEGGATEGPIGNTTSGFDNSGAWSGSGLGDVSDPAAIADLDAANKQINFSSTQAQAIAKAADKAVADNAFSWGAFAKSVAKGAIVGFPAGMPGVAFGALAGAIKGAIDQYGTISQAITASAPTSISSTGTNTSLSSMSSFDSPGGDSVWDGNGFVSPTSQTGQQAIAQASGQTLSGGGTNVSNLSLEDQLKTEQLEILRQQRSETEALNKLTYQAAGLIKDETTGQWRKATEDEMYSFMDETERQEYDIYKQQLTRQQQALSGTLPISPALEREISDWDAQSKESLTRKLGSDYMTSTPGIQSENRQQERTGLLREEARRGEISAGSSRVIDWRNSLNNENTQQLNTLSAIPGRTSSMLTGYQNALVPYTNESNTNAQINASNARTSQILADEAYWKNKEIESKNRAGQWNAIGTGLGYLFS
jgi:hypothetical protein